MERQNPIVPFLVAILLCDHVIVEEGTQKKSLIGLFDRVLASQFPVAQPATVYARLTDADGDYKFRIDLMHVESGEVFTSVTSAPLQVTDRLSVQEIVVLLPATIPRPGRYEYRLFANDAYLGGIVFTAEQLTT